MEMVQRLQFSDIFPDEEKQDIVYYLENVSNELLLKIIGFCNTRHSINFDNFFKNSSIQIDINNRVERYRIKYRVFNELILISNYASLKLTEHILSNKNIFKNNTISIDVDELNVFKAFLIINEELNNLQKFEDLNIDHFEKIVDYNLLMKFPESDIGMYDNDNDEFLKLIYATIYKVEELFKFLNSNSDFDILIKEFLNSFNSNSESDFFKQMLNLFIFLIKAKSSNSYRFNIGNSEGLDFIKSMVSENIKLDEDFTYLKNNPIYFIDKEHFSIVNYFFVIDKFYRSTKFKLKEIYNNKPELKEEYGDFFGFFNKKFSEEFLMKNVLDNIFHRKFHIKKTPYNIELDGEPDYYIRYNKSIFLFENKDVLVSKTIKSSANISDLNKFLYSRFVKDGSKPIGIGQLINSINDINNKRFRFDDFVNEKKNFKIYPILLIQDRIFQTPGINYRLNKWFKENLKIEINNNNNVKDLTVIDIDTLIFCTSYFKKKDSNFKILLDYHLDLMTTLKKMNTNDIKLNFKRFKSNINNQLYPISTRKIIEKPELSLLKNKIIDLIDDK